MNKYNDMYELRKNGKTYDEIGKEFNMTSAGAMYILKTYFPLIKSIKIKKRICCLRCKKIFYCYETSRPLAKFCCKDCSVTYRYENRMTVSEKREFHKNRKRKYYRTKRGHDVTLALGKKSRDKYPEKNKARSLVAAALRNKTIIKPDKCSNCGKKVKLDAHHDDYTKPLIVRWLCRVCHSEHHKKLTSKM